MTFVLIPGAGGDAWYWHRVLPLLEGRGARAIAVDLPADDDTAGLAEYADVIAAAAAAEADVTIVAQSMGGLSAPLVCDRPAVRQLVLVNAMVPRPGETGGEWWENTGQHEAWVARARADGRERVEFDVVTDFFHDVPQAVTDEAFARGERDQSGRPFEDPWPLAAWPDVRTRAVAGADDRFFPAQFQQRVARERLGLECDVLPGGHLIALSRPRELADYLLRVG
jgi:pimeloyl-ACP methyl ester carboxylesterase